MIRAAITNSLATVCLGLAACSGAPDGTAPASNAPDALRQEAIVQRDAEQMVNALYAGKYDVVIAYTHPVILAGLGGKAKAREAVEAAVAPILAKGCRVESFRFPEPPEFVLTERALYAVVPTAMVLTIGDERIESLNYQFGVLEPGNSLWRYIEGARINRESVAALFPDFPANHQFPPTARKKL